MKPGAGAMTAQMCLQIGLVLLIVFLLSIPIGHYLANIVMDRRTWLDPVFDRVALIIPLLIPLALRGVRFMPKSAETTSIASCWYMASAA